MHFVRLGGGRNRIKGHRFVLTVLSVCLSLVSVLDTEMFPVLGQTILYRSMTFVHGVDF